MLFKNKNIRSGYIVMFVVYIVGAVITGLSLLAIICGLISAKKTLDNVQHIDTALQDSGNLAGKAVYFDITETPVYLCEASNKSNYYLLTDGNEYRVGDMEEEEYEDIKSAVEATGSYHIQGMTHYIISSDKSRNRVASEAEKLIGQSLTDETMDDVLGEVCIEYMKINFWNMFRNGFGLVGIIFGLIGLPIFKGGSYEMKLSRKVTSISNITAKDIDEETCKEGAVWLNDMRIYLTENMVIGIHGEGDNDYEGHVALKYDEVKRIYSYSKVKDGVKSDISARYIVEVMATDGKKYILPSSKYSRYSNVLAFETEKLYKRIKEKNPGVIFEPEGVKYQTYRFSYILENEDGKYDATVKLDESRKEDIIMYFDHTNLKSKFEPVDAIVSIKMDFPAEGIAEITTGYFGDRASEVETVLYDFLKKELIGDSYVEDDEDEDEEYDTYNEYSEYGISFKEISAKYTCNTENNQEQSEQSGCYSRF